MWELVNSGEINLRNLGKPGVLNIMKELIINLDSLLTAGIVLRNVNPLSIAWNPLKKIFGYFDFSNAELIEGEIEEYGGRKGILSFCIPGKTKF